MKLKTGIILIASTLMVCTAFGAKMETKTAVDPNGYAYRYVTNELSIRAIRAAAMSRGSMVM